MICNKKRTNLSITDFGQKFMTWDRRTHNIAGFIIRLAGAQHSIDMGQWYNSTKTNCTT